MSNKTTDLFYQRLSRGQKDKNIVKYGYGDQKPTTFFGSFAEPLCFLALIVCVCIIIFGLKYVNEDFHKTYDISTFHKKTTKPKDTEELRIDGSPS